MEGVTPNKVLESLMHDGTFDAMRQKLTHQLKHNEELKKFTTSLVERSQTLNAAGAEHKSRRELFDALRRELESQVLERASKEAWDLILAKDGFGKEIALNVDKMYCELSGLEPPAYYARQESTPSHDNNNHAV